MNKLELVKEWRRTFGLPVSETPVVLSADQLKLHAKLISDEADEILDAISTNESGLSQWINRLKARDVCVDLVYFVMGLWAEAGLPPVEEEFILMRCLDYVMDLKGNNADALKDIHSDIKSVCVQIPAQPDKLLVNAIALIVMSLSIDVIMRELNRFSDDFSAVHAANMAKLWSLNQIADTFSQEEAQFAAHSQVGWSREIQGGFNVTCQRLVYSGTEPGFVVRLNGKVQKPPGWKAAVLEGGAV